MPGMTLDGARVGLLEGRMGTELANLVRRHGGVPVEAPAIREVPLAATDAVRDLLEGLRNGAVEVVVLLTGVGVDTVFAEAERQGGGAELLHLLQGATTVCRGPKPRAALRRRGVTATLLVPEPYTTNELLETLSRVELAGRGVAVVHYGERSSVISGMISSRGGKALDLCVYEWALPEDTTPIERLIGGVLEGAIDALAFTSQVQVRHLLAVAAERGIERELVEALGTGRVAVAAVGPTCAQALRSAGISPAVVPSNPKMGAMVIALAEHLAGSAGSSS